MSTDRDCTVGPARTQRGDRDGTIIEVDTAFVDRLRSVARADMPGEPVVFAYLFGSRAAGGAQVGSDTDIAILPSRGLSAQQRAALRNRVAAIIEPVARGEVDVVLLDDAPLPVRGRILRQRQVLYSADEPLRVRWESLTGRMYADSRIKLDLLDNDLLVETAAGRR
ncbi:MAG: type VII toxin-antitoxin system MntA family adenylyltransferase antitoxin [Pseudonocardiaceae bacterium]